MKCIHCGVELADGFCKKCGWSPELEAYMDSKEEPEHPPDDTSKIARVCRAVSYLVMAVLVLGSVVWGFVAWASETENGALGWGIFLGGSLGGIFTGLFLLGISEIIRLLEDIRRRLK